jgi:hypothetical protein
MSKDTKDKWTDDRLTKEYLSLVCVYRCHIRNEELGWADIPPSSSKSTGIIFGG